MISGASVFLKRPARRAVDFLTNPIAPLPGISWVALAGTSLRYNHPSMPTSGFFSVKLEGNRKIYVYLTSLAFVLRWIRTSSVFPAALERLLTLNFVRMFRLRGIEQQHLELVVLPLTPNPTGVLEMRGP